MWPKNGHLSRILSQNLDGPGFADIPTHQNQAFCHKIRRCHGSQTESGGEAGTDEPAPLVKHLFLVWTGKPVPRPVLAIHHGDGLTDGSHLTVGGRVANDAGHSSCPAAGAALLPCRANWKRLAGRCHPRCRLGRICLSHTLAVVHRNPASATGKNLSEDSIGFRGVLMPYRFLPLGSSDTLQGGC